MTNTILLIYQSENKKTFVLENSEYDETLIYDVIEKKLETIQDWQDPISYLTDLFADEPIKQVKYIDKNFDIDNCYLDDAINDYLNDNITGVENFLKSLEKIVSFNPDAAMIKDYLKNL